MNHVASFAVTAALAAAAAAPAADAQAQDFRWSGRIAQGQTVRVQGISGGVRAEHTSGDRVEVVARRSGRDAARVEVRAVETGGGVTLCAVYPGSSTSDGPCRSSEPRSAEGRHDRFDAQVEFTVRVPTGVRLDVGVVSGDVHAVGLRSPVEASTVSGDIRIATSSTARANTVSGDIDATFGATDGRGMSFNAVSGRITLRLAGDAGARVSANTLSGEITSDFELERGPRSDRRGGGVNVRVGRTARGVIGRGGPELGINTVSGDIRIVRAR